MSRRGRSRDDFVELASTGARGVAEWTSATELHEKERQWLRAAGGVGAAAAAALFALPSLGAPAVLAVEAVLALPAGVVAGKLRDLNRMHRLARRRVDEQLLEVMDQQDTDQLLARIGRLADELPAGLQRDGRDAYRLASRIAAERLRLLRRVADLEALVARAKGDGSSRRLRDRLKSTVEDAERLRFKLERLAVVLAELVDVSDDDGLAVVADRMRESEERLRALAEALVELRNEALG